MHLKHNTVLFLAATASALQVTSPTKNAKLDLSTSNKLTWSYVESDPTSFDVQLVNEHVNPPIAKTIATNVQTSAGSYTFNRMSAAVGEGYQINLISNEPQNTGILAQSPNFVIERDGGGSSSTVSASFTTTTATTATTASTSSGTLGSSSVTTTTTASAGSSSSSRARVSSSSSSTALPSTAAANVLGVSAAMGGIVGGGVLALLL